MVAGALLVACGGGGFDGDPYDTVVDAASNSLELPLAVDVDVQVDADRLAELMRMTGDADAAAGFAMLGGGPMDLAVELTVAENGLHASLAHDGETIGAFHLEDGQPPLVRIADEASRALPMLSFARGFAPELFTGAWVELQGAPPLALTDLEAELAAVRSDMAASPRAEVESQFRIVHVEDDRDGWRFEVTPGPDVTDVPDGIGFDVWVDDDQLSRVLLDVGPFAAMDEPQLSTEDLTGVAVVDVTRASRNLPPRPVAESTADLDRIGGF